jgi:epoxide hydrolase-like predicted phosphatase
VKKSAVLFDLGGVVLDSPTLEAIDDYEKDNRIAQGAINRLVAAAGEEGAWAQHEKGEVDFATFCNAFESECAEAGLVVDPAELMARIAAGVKPRPPMIDAIRRLRGDGIRVGAVTNNWESLRHDYLSPEFDVMVESCREGVRKPDPEIYRRALTRLGVEAAATATIDDIGANLKTARDLGMATHKMGDIADAIRFLEETTGVDLSQTPAARYQPPAKPAT